MEKLWYKEHNDEVIKGFFGEYRFLSNFHIADIDYEGIIYPTSEHAYQAAKTLDEEERLKISKLSPQDAKREGRLITLRPRWDKIKMSVMFEILDYKFSAYNDLNLALQQTEGKYLEETNHWGDVYWGVDCKSNEGLNMLGQVLMAIRESWL